MSYLVQRVGREDQFTNTLEKQLAKRISEDSQETRNPHRDDEWDHLWNDVGGEA